MLTLPVSIRFPRLALSGGLALGMLLALAAVPFQAHATLECLTDEEAVIQCEPLFMDLDSLRPGHKRNARCIENCAVCAALPEDLRAN